MWLALPKFLAAGVVAGLAGVASLAPAGRQADGANIPQLVAVALPGGGGLGVAPLEVTYGEWKLCVDDGGCGHLPRPAVTPLPGAIPVTGVSHLDIRDYISWLNGRSGRHFRLPTQAEWLFLARSVDRPKFPKTFSDPRLAWAADYGAMPKVDPTVRTSGAFGVSEDGIADLGGNVWEWTASCVSSRFDGATCPAYIAEGLHEAKISIFIRDPAQGGCATGVPPPHVGFRLVEDLP
jgi:formylglycine-generating enzyme required for sulfatase activity